MGADQQDDLAFERWEQGTQQQREKVTAPLEALKRQVVQRELNEARVQEVDVTVELDDGSLRLLSELTPAEERRIVAIRRDLWPWDGEDLDDDEPR